MMGLMTHASHSPEETQRFAQEQAQVLTQYAGPLVIALEGDLGAGKTTFTQAFAEALGVHERVKSPTFVLMKHYHLSGLEKYDTLYHLDCYRLQHASDLDPLGVKEIIQQPKSIILIEWAERVKDILPKTYWLIRIEHVSEQERNITITKHE